MGEEIRKLSCHATILIRLHDTQSRRGSGIGSKLKMGCFALATVALAKTVSYHTARNVSSTIGFPCDDAQVHVWRFRTAISMVFSTAIWVTILI